MSHDKFHEKIEGKSVFARPSGWPPKIIWCGSARDGLPASKPVYCISISFAT